MAHSCAALLVGGSQGAIFSLGFDPSSSSFRGELTVVYLVQCRTQEDFFKYAGAAAVALLLLLILSGPP